MRERLLLGPVMIAALVGGLWLDEAVDAMRAPAWLSRAASADGTLPPGVVMFVAMAVIAVVAVQELAAILHDKGIEASRRIMTVAALLGLVVSALVPSGADGVEAVAAVSTAAALVLAMSLAFHSRHKTVQGAVAAAGGALLALVYLGLMFGFLLAIRREHSAWVLLWALATIKACDIGAYFTGKSIGKRKLIPWLSPGKTWEGLIGGVVASMAVGWGGLEVMERAGVFPAVAWWAAVVPGLLFAVTGQAGDLIMSLFKRDAGIKDSGQILPGFGGVLDVLDSPLLVAPLAYWVLRGLVPGA